MLKYKNAEKGNCIARLIKMNCTEITALNKGTLKKGMIGELAKSHV